MNKQEIISLVKRLDTASSLEQNAAWAKLRLLQEQVVPYLLEAYPTTRRWQGRSARMLFARRRVIRT